MVDVKQVGFYDNAGRIIEIPKALIAALGAVMLPRTSYLLAEGQKEKSKYYIEVTILYVMIISSVLMFGLISVSDIFSIIFWGEEFLESGRLISAMSPAFVFSVLGNIIRTQYLIPRAKDKDYVVSLIAGAVVNLVLNYFFIKPFGAMGATVSTVLAEFVLSGMQFWSVRRDLDLKRYLKNGLIFYLFGLIMYLVIITLKTQLPYNIMSL
ncbi:TPA: lipopolysaccharide biosynthesis protein, partial [Streptococcus pneumoniae]